MSTTSIQYPYQYPFTAIVGQEELKLALVLTAIDPSIGGVLAMGDRGTGKSTAIRALAALLPCLKAVSECPYHCDPNASPDQLCDACRARLAAQASAASKKTKSKRAPTRLLPTCVFTTPVVDLPLGAGEDRVIGAISIEKALTEGKKEFEPGLLAAANRGYLYIDEVNLLEDHLVDLLIDVAASGVNVVERDGLSIRHPARFVLVGSGNPEEGELRPQLLDRFGLSCEVITPQNIADRIEIIRRRDEFDRDPRSFCERWAQENQLLSNRVVAARKRLARVEVPMALHEKAAELCLEAGTDGLRGELTLLRCMRAYAAYDGEKTATLRHLTAIAPAALRHRLRRNPLDDSGSTVRVERAMQAVGLLGAGLTETRAEAVIRQAARSSSLHAA